MYAISVLLVEDHEGTRRVYARLLQEYGLCIRTAENGAAAMAALLREAIDVVVSDIQMPVMDGLEFARLVRAHSDYAKLPLIAVTAYGPPDAAASAGYDIVLAKPVSSICLHFIILLSG